MIQLKRKVLIKKKEPRDVTPNGGACICMCMYFVLLLLHRSHPRRSVCMCCVAYVCSCVCRPLYISVHLIFLRFDLSLARPLVVLESSVFRERISRIKSKNTCERRREREPGVGDKRAHTRERKSERDKSVCEI